MAAARSEIVAAGMAAHNAGRSVKQWSRTARVDEVNALAEQVGIKARKTKAATVDAIARAPRPAVVEAGMQRILDRKSLRVWARAARPVDVEALAARAGVLPGRTKTSTLRALSDAGRRIRILNTQGRRLEKLSTGTAVRIADTFEDARRALLEGLEAITTASPSVKLRAQLAAIRLFGRRFASRLAGEIDRTEGAVHDRVAGDLATLLDERGLRAAMRARLARQRLGLHKFAITRLVSDMVAQLQRQASARAHRPALETARALAGLRGLLSGFRARTALIVRQELMRIYNNGQIEAAEEVDPGPRRKVVKRIDEFLDNRNHPFSRAANGRRADLSKPFRVPQAEVASWGLALKRSTGGVFWAARGGNFEGMSLPAHFNDRGRVVIEVVDV